MSHTVKQNPVEPGAELHVEDTEAGGRDASEHVLVLDTELKSLLAVFDDVDSEYDGPELFEPVQDTGNVLGLVEANLAHVLDPDVTDAFFILGNESVTATWIQEVVAQLALFTEL